MNTKRDSQGKAENTTHKNFNKSSILCKYNYTHNDNNMCTWTKCTKA